ncbi:hypothetical protein K1719_018399 [Acacia pycnantha]|nr:hypothetical protein K1719_018399 [Acacia pycnantha]
MERSQYKSYEEFDFGRCPIWIQVHNVPLEALCLENAIMIGGYVGEVVLAEDPHYNGRYLRNFLRVRILLDLRKSLAYGFWLPKPNGSRAWISIRYEKLPNFCYSCGKVGHDNRNCKSEKLMSAVNVSEPRFGSWLSTNVCRSWEEVMVIRTKVESTYEEEDLFTIKMHKPSKGFQEQKQVIDLDRKNAMQNCHKKVTSKEATGLAEVSLTSNSDALEDPNMSLIQHSDVNPSTSTSVQQEHSLAIIPFSGKILTEVINVLDGLGLKRNAEEELASKVDKKRRTNNLKADVSTPVVSLYAGSLRKAKSRARSTTKRKMREGKENLMEEEEPVLEDELMAQESPNVGEPVFVFKAKGGRKKKNIAEDCDYIDDKAPRSFKFEVSWTQHVDFISTVEMGWNDVDGDVGDKIQDLIRRLEVCRKKLMEWSRREFPNFKKIIDHL